MNIKYNGAEYDIFFYPCGGLLSVTKYRNNKQFTRDIKYDGNMTIEDFLKNLEKINFYL